MPTTTKPKKEDIVLPSLLSDNNKDQKIQELESKLFHLQEFANLVREKQIEHALRLSKQTTITIGKKEYKKKPLTAKQFRQIAVLNDQLATEAKSDLERIDKLLELRQLAAEYYFGIPSNVFDENYEMLSPIMEGHILRSTSGLSPDIDIEKLLVEYQGNGHNKQ